MKFSDIRKGQRLSIDGDAGIVVSTGVAAWAYHYDIDPAEKIYSYTIADAGPFQPVNEVPSSDVYLLEDLREHDAVRRHGKGVTSEELASFVEVLADLGQSRIKGTGAEQYGQGGKQKFESMTHDELVTGLIEELSDAQNYLAMIAIKALAADACS